MAKSTSRATSIVRRIRKRNVTVEEFIIATAILSFALAILIPNLHRIKRLGAYHGNSLMPSYVASAAEANRDGRDPWRMGSADGRIFVEGTDAMAGNYEVIYSQGDESGRRRARIDGVAGMHDD